MKKIFFCRLAAILTIITMPIHIYSSNNNEKYFVIVIPSYNNARWYEKNLTSVLNQKYEKFHVLYTDDCSNDNTAVLVEEYLQCYDTNNKVTLIKNSERHGALYNLYRMINMCDDDCIIVTLDGDDWLPDDAVLERLNNMYADEIWLTYGQFQLYPSETRGWASPMPDYIVQNNAFRDFQHLPTHLRTFYSWLFKQIKLEDLLYLGDFYAMTWDMAMMFPMIEMAGERHRFIPDIMYIYNDANNISDHHVSRQLQAHLAQIIKKKSRYRRLSQKPPTEKTTVQSSADVVIFAQTPANLQSILESLDRYVDGIGNIFILYKPSSIAEKQEYTALIAHYPTIQFYLIDEHRSNFKKTLFDIYTTTNSDYILFSKGDTSFEKPISLNECITHLEKAYAYAFYFKINGHDCQHYNPHLPLIKCSITHDISAWDFSLARAKWSAANSLDLVLHHKQDSLYEALQGYYDLTPSGLELAWGNEGNLNRLGLCFNTSKVKTMF